MRSAGQGPACIMLTGTASATGSAGCANGCGRDRTMAAARWRLRWSAWAARKHTPDSQSPPDSGESPSGEGRLRATVLMSERTARYSPLPASPPVRAAISRREEIARWTSPPLPTAPAERAAPGGSRLRASSGWPKTGTSQLKRMDRACAAEARPGGRARLEPEAFDVPLVLEPCSAHRFGPPGYRGAFAANTEYAHERHRSGRKALFPNFWWSEARVGTGFRFRRL